MLILWIKKNLGAKDKNQNKQNEALFKKHDQEMKRFRQNHPQQELIDPVEFVTPDGGPLVPIISIKLGKNTQN
jgi:hypothetical protein